MRNDERMNALLRENSNPIFGEANVYQGPHITASTDMGDVSHLMPVIHPWVGCISGVLHSAEYEISVPDVAYIKTANPWMNNRHQVRYVPHVCTSCNMWALVYISFTKDRI